MNILKKLVLTAGVLLVLVLVVSQFLPSKYHVERSIVIAAKADAIHPWINNLKKWPEWSAWTSAQDASLVFTYEGPEEGVGAISKWEAKQLGQGQMKVVESDVTKGVKFDLSFERGKYLSTGTFTYAVESDGTKVTWGTEGKVSRNPVDRISNLLFMDRMMGQGLEVGLGSLKQKVEGK